MKNLFILIAIFFVSGCSSSSVDTMKSGISTINNQEIVRYDNSDKLTVVRDNRVVRADQVVTIHPNKNLTEPPKALFVPLGLTQDSQDKERISQTLSHIIWQQFISEKVFSHFEYANMSPPYRVADALYYARNRGAEFLVGGYITYFYDGGGIGSTRASIIIEVYDVANGNLIWSIAHAGEMPAEKARDYALFQVKNAMPYDPTYAVLSELANDIARLLQMWTTPPPFIPNPDSERRAF